MAEKSSDGTVAHGAAHDIMEWYRHYTFTRKLTAREIVPMDYEHAGDHEEVF